MAKQQRSLKRLFLNGLGLGLSCLLVWGLSLWYRVYTNAPLLLVWDRSPTTMIIEVEGYPPFSPFTHLQVGGDGHMRWNSHTGQHETQLSEAQLLALLQQINFRTPNPSPFSSIITPLDRAATLRVNLTAWQRECIVFWNWQTQPEWRCGGLYAALLTITDEAK